LLLVRHAPTAATKRTAFPADEPLDADARAAASRVLKGRFPADALVISSPALRAKQTAAAAGFEPEIEPQLSECDFGAWAGRTLAEVHAEDPEAAVGWMTDPHAAPHRGESLAGFSARVKAWLEAQATAEGTALVITHAGVIAAAVSHALQAPLDAVWRIKPAPLSRTELVFVDGAWVVEQVGAPN
jgi:broad specificity phosphatase PhoE